MRHDTTEQIIIKNEGLIYYTLDLLNCKYSDEAISVAYEALWRSVETFDKSAGTKFSTYAVTCIKNAIYGLFRRQKEIQEYEVPLEDLMIGRCDPEIEQPELTETQEYVRLAVDDALKTFSGKKQQIAKLWIESNLSATAIAKEVGCSQSYASQTISQVKYVIRQELINAGYSPNLDGNK